MNTLTPRTDKAVQESNGQWSFAMRNLCIQMECEIAALTKELAEARSMTEGQWLLKVAARLVTAGCKSDGIVDAMDELIQQRDTLAEALEMVTTHNPVDNQCDNGYSPRYVAKQALAAVKGGNDE